MKLASILAFGASAMMVGFANAEDATLEQKWAIDDDNVSFVYDSLSFKLGFPVSSFISNEGGTYDMARFIIYDDACQNGNNVVTASTDGIQSIVPDAGELNPAAGDGLATDRTVFVNITIDSETISGNSDLYSEETDGAVTAEIRFCVRFGLHTTSATSVEVNFLETLVTLNVDLTDGFRIGSLAVEPRDRLVRTANQVYSVEGFLCDDAIGTPRSNTSPINQGTVVRVCVRPDSEA